MRSLVLKNIFFNYVFIIYFFQLYVCAGAECLDNSLHSKGNQFFFKRFLCKAGGLSLLGYFTYKKCSEVFCKKEYFFVCVSTLFIGFLADTMANERKKKETGGNDKNKILKTLLRSFFFGSGCLECLIHYKVSSGDLNPNILPAFSLLALCSVIVEEYLHYEKVEKIAEVEKIATSILGTATNTHNFAKHSSFTNNNTLVKPSDENNEKQLSDYFSNHISVLRDNSKQSGTNIENIENMFLSYLSFVMQQEHNSYSLTPDWEQLLKWRDENECLCKEQYSQEKKDKIVSFYELQIKNMSQQSTLLFPDSSS